MATLKVRRRGWIAAFLIMVIAVFVAVHFFTGYDAIGTAVRFVWNGVAFLANSAIRLFGGFVSAVARTVGIRRLARVATAVAGVGLGYAGSVILSDQKLKKAHGWRGKLRAAITVLRNRWVSLHLFWKLCIVAVLIASQVYLHILLIIFPIAFLVPVVRRTWGIAADQMLGGWYRRKMARAHRAMMRLMRRMPGHRQTVGTARLLRMRYLCAWRLWRYDPRFRDSKTGHRHVSLVEPVRLWWRGELDHYIEHPLLAGTAATRLSLQARSNV